MSKGTRQAKLNNDKVYITWFFFILSMRSGQMCLVFFFMILCRGFTFSGKLLFTKYTDKFGTRILSMLESFSANL